MKGRILAGLLFGIFFVMILSGGGPAQARSHTIGTLDTMFSALNSGDVDAAAVWFAEDAIVENHVRKETYRGESAIRQMLAGMQKDGRQFTIISSVDDGDIVRATVEVSDRGIVWGTQTVEAEIRDDMVYSLAITAFRLELWRIGL